MWEKIGQKAGWMKVAGKSVDNKPITKFEGSWADKQGKESLPKKEQHPTHSEEQKLMDVRKETDLDRQSRKVDTLIGKMQRDPKLRPAPFDK